MRPPLLYRGIHAYRGPSWRRISPFSTEGGGSMEVVLSSKFIISRIITTAPLALHAPTRNRAKLSLYSIRITKGGFFGREESRPEKKKC
ncbi:hypothetical protein J437_LFUL000026 [Ladona fulva]|uniref:Uncharacterized protein n=1 Tax=Ladona fulva TaxID=123851 RepID=A0A8K0NXB4_LADFU|nr:hypothetical protein J437_LFUL000026 [Ladona fulva]